MKLPPLQTAVFSAASLLSFGGDDRPEVLAEDLRVLLQRLIGAEEDDALLLEVLADVVVDDLGVVLAADAGEVLLLRLRDAELVVRAPDVVGHVVPRLRGLVGRA